MLKQILSIFSGDSPLTKITDKFTRMVEVANEMVIEASDIYWLGGDSPERRAELYQRDMKINKLVRKVRRLVTTHLSVHAPRDVAYGLLMMSLVKDVERIGDYAKNLVDISTLVTEPMPDIPLVAELREVRESVEELARDALKVFLESDEVRAAVLIQEGRRVSKICDAIVEKAAHSSLSSADAVKISNGARFYKRIEGHYVNLISSVVMPLHKLDFYDETLMPGTEAEYESDEEGV